LVAGRGITAQDALPSIKLVEKLTPNGNNKQF